MSIKADRGAKRTCQNPECGSRFYDLNRDPIVCPICQTAYQVEASPRAMAAVAPIVAEKAAQRKPAKKPVYPAETGKPDETPDVPESGSPASSAASSMPDATEPARGRDVGLPGGDEGDRERLRDDVGSTDGSGSTGDRTLGRPDRH